MSTKNPSQAADAFGDALSQSATLRATAVKYLGQGQEAQSSALAIEQSRIASRYGDNSAESKKTAARMLGNKARGNMVTLETQRSQVAAPQPAPEEFIVYGRVVDATGTPHKGVDIVATGSACRTLASTVADSEGAFLLCVPTAAAASEDKVSKEETGASQKAQEDASAAPAQLTFYLVLSDKGKTQTFRDPEIFEAKGGQIAYREIVMPAKPATTKSE